MKAVTGLAVLRRATRRITSVVLASSVLAASAGATAPPSSHEAVTAAKWVPRKIHFMYSAMIPSAETTYYSCDSLQERIKTLLRQLGARDEVVKPFGCFSDGPEKFPGVDATFSVLEPVEAGDQSAAQKVEARWHTVTVNPDGTCALIEQAKLRILPLFATRNESSGCTPRFSVEILEPVKSH
jgi:hypothetical protein